MHPVHNTSSVSMTPSVQPLKKDVQIAESLIGALGLSSILLFTAACFAPSPYTSPLIGLASRSGIIAIGFQCHLDSGTISPEIVKSAIKILSCTSLIIFFARSIPPLSWDFKWDGIALGASIAASILIFEFGNEGKIERLFRESSLRSIDQGITALHVERFAKRQSDSQKFNVALKNCMNLRRNDLANVILDLYLSKFPHHSDLNSDIELLAYCAQLNRPDDVSHFMDGKLDASIWIDRSVAHIMSSTDVSRASSDALAIKLILNHGNISDTKLKWHLQKAQNALSSHELFEALLSNKPNCLEKREALLTMAVHCNNHHAVRTHLLMGEISQECQDLCFQKAALKINLRIIWAFLKHGLISDHCKALSKFHMKQELEKRQIPKEMSSSYVDAIFLSESLTDLISRNHNFYKLISTDIKQDLESFRIFHNTLGLLLSRPSFEHEKFDKLASIVALVKKSDYL